MPTSTKSSVQEKSFQLKGSLFTFTVLQLISTNPEAFSTQLTDLIKQAPKFFEHAPIVIDLQLLSEEDNTVDLPTIVAALKAQHLIPVGIRSNQPKHHKAAQSIGLAILSLPKSDSAEASITEPTPKTSAKKAATPAPAPEHHTTLLITKPVRSGQQIYAKGGDLVITAPVSQGSELIADGNIHIYGPLRGRALAGVNGNNDARIFCMSLEAELVSIAGNYIVNDALIQKTTNTPTQVFLEHGKLQIKSL
ncbi:MAG: septum site-determining protein MinC [Proteobacteria bacterium]|nr:septum site-determining protein MinC [Pseudomonadota bacterium]